MTDPGSSELGPRFLEPTWKYRILYLVRHAKKGCIRILFRGLRKRDSGGKGMNA